MGIAFLDNHEKSTLINEKKRNGQSQSPYSQSIKLTQRVSITEHLNMIGNFAEFQTSLKKKINSKGLSSWFTQNTKKCKFINLRWNCYKYFAGISPSGIIPSIGVNTFNEIVYLGNMIDKNTKISDLDVEFIATNSNPIVKNNILCPDRQLVWFQMMEVFVWIAIHKYYKARIVDDIY